MSALPGTYSRDRDARSEPDRPEEQLVSEAARGSETAVRALIRRYNSRLFRVARGIVGSDAEAEDVVQETWLAAFTGLNGFRGDAAFSTWITRIAINAALMRVRRVRPGEEYDTVNENDALRVLPFPGQAVETSEAALGRNQLRGLLEAAVSELPPDLRLVFVMREAEGLTMREIGRDLGIHPVTAKTRLYRARRRLRTNLERRIQGGFDAIFPFDGARCADMADRIVAQLTEIDVLRDKG